MRNNPYLLERPAVISFSGGRTSGYMLRQVIDAFGGSLPDDVKILFANTGKERRETLDFVEWCGTRWNVPIIWLEYRRGDPAGHSFAQVKYLTASRVGEPFEAIVDYYRDYRQPRGLGPLLPNPTRRFCTSELKLRSMRRYLRSIGWKRWTDAVGLRFDEPHRVSRLAASRETSSDLVTPLYSAKVTEPDVLSFWNSQDFDLQLRPDEGNCDLCFLKGRDKIARLIRERPESAAWWAKMESDTGETFRRDRPGYAATLKLVRESPELPFADEDRYPECRCTD